MFDLIQQPNIICTILAVIYLSIMYPVMRILKQRDKKIELEKYKIDIKYGPSLGVEQKLDLIIDAIFDEYRLYNLEYRSDEYIKEIEEKAIVQEICDMVIDRLSPVFITQLSTYFNIDNLGTIIATKISIKVTEYRVLRNTNNLDKK